MIGIARGLFKSNVKSGSGVAPFDPDAQTFITAANITNPTQQSAVNQLVLDFKSIGVWTKEKALYPVLGGSASSHAVNLKQPGTFNLSFATGWTHSNNGILPNGATYADTFLNSNTSLNLNNTHVSFYSKTNVDGGCDLGLFNSTTNSAIQIFPKTSGSRYIRVFSSFTISSTTETTTAYYINNRIVSTQMVGYRNGINVQTVVLNSISNINDKITISARNIISGFDNYSTRQSAFVSIGDGLTDTEALNKTVAVQKYQRALGRAVDMEIQVGTGATRSYYTPFSTLDNYSISGNIYLQSEVIGAAIPILGIEMYFSGFTLPYTMTNQEIYLAHVSQSQFDSAPAVDFSDLTLSNLTLVKASFTFTAANNSWVRMNFDTPFQYNGISNILVIWKNNKGTWTSGGGGTDTHTSTSRSMYKVGSTGQPTGNGTLTNNRSNIKFIW